MSRGQMLTLAMLGLAGGVWWLALEVLDRLGLADAALPLCGLALILALTLAETVLQRLHPPDDHG